MNKSTVVLLLILVALLSGGGVYFWKQAELDAVMELDEVLKVESEMKTFTFGTVNYELDYPADWTYSVNGDRTVFVDIDGNEMMTVWWNWEGGIESNLLSSGGRNFDKNGQPVSLHLSVFGESEPENVYMSLSAGSGDIWFQYSAAIFLDPSLHESGVAGEIYESIR